jgi:nicotinamidase-related amidase
VVRWLRYDRKLSLTTTEQDSVLVLIDIQERLAAAMANGVRERLIAQVSILLNAAKVLSVPVIVTEQYPKGLGPTELELKSLLSEAVPIIEKTSFSSVKADGFLEAITDTKRTQIILTGMETHICIVQSALDLQQQGYQVFVVEDAVSSRSALNQDNALHRMRQAGIIISNVESIVFEWLGDAKHREFRRLSKLIVE